MADASRLPRAESVTWTQAAKRDFGTRGLLVRSGFHNSYFLKRTWLPAHYLLNGELTEELVPEGTSILTMAKLQNIADLSVLKVSKVCVMLYLRAHHSFTI